MDLNRTHPRRKAAQSRGLSASLRRLATRRALPLLAAGALLASAGLRPAQAGTFNYTGGGAGTAAAPITGLFSNGFDSTVTGAIIADTLSFGGTTAYTATDDLTTQLLINALTFNGSGNVAVARGGAGTNNSISLGGATPAVNFANTGTGTLTFGLDLSFASSGFLVKSSSPNFTANPVLTGALNLGGAANTVTIALADTGGDAQAELALTGLISGAGSLTLANNATVPAGITMANQQDYGTLLITGANTYSGGTNINFGRLVVTNGSALGAGAINIAQAATSGGTLQLGNGTYTNGLIPTGITIANAINLAGAISGDYGNGIQNNQGNNTLSGVVTLTAAQANIAVGGGSLTSTGGIVLTAAQSTLAVNAGTLTSTGGISQATGTTASLIKGGGGTLVLASNNNTYTGSTTINGGFIQVGTGGVLAGGVVTPSSVLGATSSIINNGGQNGGLTLNYSNNISLDVSTITGTPSTTTPGTFNNANGRISQAGPGILTLTGTGTQGGYFTKTGTLLVGAGATLTGSNYSSIGVDSGDHGTLTIQGTGSLTVGTDFNVGDNVGAAGVLNISGGSLTANALFFGKNATSTGQVTQTGGAVKANAGETWIGNGNGATGTYSISGGSLTTSNWLAVGRSAGSTGVLNISGNASVTKLTTAGNITVAGNGGIETGTINQSGGTLTNTASGTWIGESGNGTYNLSGGTASLGVLDIDHAGSAATSSGVVNQSGGTLSVTQVVKTGTQGTATFNFNGGTLQANTGAVAATFMQGLTAANVQTGGVTFDTTNSGVTVAQVLQHDPTAGAPATDGGLTKAGANTLTLTGANTYTGGTKVNNGTLDVTSTGRIGSGNVSVAANSALTLEAGYNGYIFSTANLFLTSPTTSLVNLLFTGTDTIGGLSVGGTFLTPGVYGSSASGVSSQFQLADLTGPGTLTVTATPEPSQYAAFGLGLLGLTGLALCARRRSAA